MCVGERESANSRHTHKHSWLLNPTPYSHGLINNHYVTVYMYFTAPTKDQTIQRHCNKSSKSGLLFAVFNKQVTIHNRFKGASIVLQAGLNAILHGISNGQNW